MKARVSGGQVPRNNSSGPIARGNAGFRLTVVLIPVKFLVEAAITVSEGKRQEAALKQMRSGDSEASAQCARTRVVDRQGFNRHMLTTFAPTSTTAMSGAPSELKSPTAIDAGAIPVFKVVAGVKVPSPFPT